MRNLLKHISKKSLALLVAVALVLTSVATIVVASADSTPRYTVTAKDPVVPMTAGYSVNLEDFDIDGEDSTALTLDGSVDAADIEIVDGVIKAYARGVYKATAGDMTVYIVVKAPNETEYVLYENDYRDYTADEVSDWTTVFTKYTGTVIGRLQATDNRESTNLISAETYPMDDNPLFKIHSSTFADEASKINYYKKHAMTNGFLPWNANTLYYYDNEAFDAAQAAYDAWVDYDAAYAAWQEAGSVEGQEPTAPEGDRVSAAPVMTNYISLRCNPATGVEVAKKAHDDGASLYAYTILDNDVLSAFQNYKVTTNMRVRTGYYGSVGVMGRVTNDGNTFNPKDGDSAVGLTVSFRDSYGRKGVLSHNNGTDALIKVNSSQQYGSPLSIPTRAQELFNTNAQGKNDTVTYTLQTYEYDFNGSNLTLSSPNVTESAPGANDNKVTIAAPEQAGSIGFFTLSYYRDINNNGAYYLTPVPCVLDIKVTLNDSVNPALLPTEKMADVSAADKVFGTEDYADNANYAFTVTYGYNVASLDFADVTQPASRHITLPFSFVDGSSIRVYSEISGLTQNGKPGAQMALDIAQVTLNDAAHNMSDSCFANTKFLEKIKMPDGLKRAATYTFSGSGVREITLPDNFETATNGMFYNCYSLADIDLGKSIKNIAGNMFFRCYSLKSIEIPASVDTIDNKNAFTDCTNLHDVYIYNPEMTIPSGTFANTVTLYGKTGSTAQTYATNNGNNFVAIDAVVDAEVEAYNTRQSQIISIDAPVGATVDLDTIPVIGSQWSCYGYQGNQILLSGANVNWADASNDNFDIADGVLTTKALTDSTLTFTGENTDDAARIKGFGGATAAQYTITVSLNIVDEANTNLTEAQYTLIPPEPSISVEADEENAFTYIATVNPQNKTLIPNSVKAIDNGKEIKVLSAYGTSGKAFAFQAVTPNAIVSAEYTTENIEDDIFYLGATIRLSTNAKGAAIQFSNRLPAITYDNGTISHGTIKLGAEGAEEAAVVSIGTLVIPSVLLGDAELKIPADADASASAIVLGEGRGQEAMNIVHQSVTAATEDFSDVKASLVGLDQLGLTEEQYKALKISAVTYIQYQKADGSIGYSYGEVAEKSYDDIYNAMYPVYATGAEYLNIYLHPSADGDYVYNDSENIVMTYSVPTNYRSYWNVQIKDGEGYEAGFDYRFASGTVDSSNYVEVVIPADKTQVTNYRTYFSIRNKDEKGEWHTFVNAIPGPTFNVVAD